MKVRNLKQHPPTIAEIEECLHALADQIELDAAQTMRCGDIRPYLLRCAAKVVLRAGFTVNDLSL